MFYFQFDAEQNLAQHLLFVSSTTATGKFGLGLLFSI
jgi:hypothetical protein